MLLGMKTNRFGRAEILSPDQISLLFNEGFKSPRDRALFGVCLYAAARINEACTLLTGDVIGIKGVRDKLVIRSHNTKGKRDTREIDVHPQLKCFLEEYQADGFNPKIPYLFPGRWGRGHIHKGSADLILREVCRRLEIPGFLPLIELTFKQYLGWQPTTVVSAKTEAWQSSNPEHNQSPETVTEETLTRYRQTQQ